MRTSFKAGAVFAGALLGSTGLPAPANGAAVCPYWGNGLAGTSGTYYNVSLITHGGSVVTSPKVVVLFWGSYWTSNATARSRHASEAGFLNTQGFWSRLNEYGGTRIGKISSTQNYATTDSLNGNTAVNDTHLQQLLRNGVSSTTDNQTIYAIILPPGVTVYRGSDVFGQGTGYHSYTGTSTGVPIYYAVVTAGNATANIAPLLSHEVSEVATDPVPNTAYEDIANFGGEGEVGDLCNQYTSALGSYQVQPIWSQSACRCLMYHNPTTTDVLGLGHTQPAVYRGGTWLVLEDNKGLGQIGFNWGGNGYPPLPGDYNGDGYADVAYYTPADQIWHISYTKPGLGLTSSMSSDVRYFGVAGAKPVPDDYAGNGTTLPAYWDKIGLVWAVQGSTTAKYSIPATYRNQHPVPGDYDGDGKVDPAFWDPATGIWSALASTSNYKTWMTFTFGGGADGYAGDSDIPTPADFDGDGYIDLAVYRPNDPSQGSGAFRFYSFYSYSTIVTPMGGVGDVPIRGDFDGDFFDDYIIYRPSSGVWYWRSAATSNWGTSVTWGNSTDTALVPYP